MANDRNEPGASDYKAQPDEHVDKQSGARVPTPDPKDQTGDPEEAMERTQDVFVRAWGKLGSFRGEAAFATWLHRLAVNVVLTDRRSAGRRERRADAAAALGPRSEPAPRAGLAVDLERAIAALPPGARAVFVLYDVEGYCHEEIAALTGIAAGTSKAQLHRARKLLREALA